ncbi:brct domain containing protein [Cordyceps fumosorosea ARSEF 2679]|uniref:Brct domain containing protein n=1 Tax=Cordyceps fumosorosea (strain ARSEF 2679) TaxID=1081104 RepID=A0A167NCG9_CORFA|nr:brct domain containing protein [Cordyceps fumosorosea ARSEF 2679]OAA55392.1 brct domain containing protein [Cordyceps fumosorosea ARSEF 2679]
MKPYTNPLPKPPPSARPRPFDPWNSSSTGHQRREAPRRETDGVSETNWRVSRASKLNRQLQTQNQQPCPSPPPSSKPTVQRKSVAEMLARPGSMRETLPSAADKTGSETPEKRQLLAGVVAYVNGSTAPLVSDHQLKAALAAHGARVSPHLARRQVTHVILGRPVAGGGGGGAGCGGGLAGTKMEREIRRRGGSGIKYVGVEWVLESIHAGKRLPEARFASVRVAPHGQASVYGALQEAGRRVTDY